VYNCGVPLAVEEPDLAVKSISKELGLYIRHYISWKEFSGLFWIRLVLDPPETTAVLPAGMATFIVVCRKSPCILLASVKRSVEGFLLAALQSGFASPQCKQIPTAGRSVHDLFDFVLSARSGAGVLSSAEREAVVAPEPVLSRKHYRMEWDESILKGEEHECNVVDEDLGEKKKRAKAAKDVFGVSDPPVLERVDVNLDLKVGDGKSARVVIRFDGTSVFKGIDEMIHQGLVEIPVPPLLASLQKQGRTEVTASTTGPQGEAVLEREKGKDVFGYESPHDEDVEEEEELGGERDNPMPMEGRKDNTGEGMSAEAEPVSRTE
jgi:hypothetical protein